MKLEVGGAGIATNTMRLRSGDFAFLTMTLEAADAVLSEDIRCAQDSYVRQQTENKQSRVVASGIMYAWISVMNESGETSPGPTSWRLVDSLALLDEAAGAPVAGAPAYCEPEPWREDR